MPSDDTIGTGGTFSTIALWEDSITALSGVHRGRCLNQNFPEQVVISGQTGASPTDYVELTADTGASFADNDSLPLRFNDSNYARIDLIGPAHQNLINIQTPYTHFNRVQVRQQHSTRPCINASATGSMVSQSIIESGASALYTENAINCLVITRSTISNGLTLDTSGRSEFCTSVHPIGSTSVAAGIRLQYGVGRIQNSTSYGFTAGFSVAAVDGSSSTNATDASTQVTGTDLINQTYTETTPFVKSAIDGTEDFKLATGSPLEGAGNPSALGVTTDIYGNTRDASNPSIGCYEPVGGPPPITVESNAVMHGTDF